MNDFRPWLEALKPSVDETLARLLPVEETPPRRLHEAMRYAVFAGGKRVRPALVVLAGETLGAPRERLLEGGAAMEMLHTFSLVHDDLPALDDDDLRRGRPTVHRQYDEALAVLVGDALLSLGLGCLARLPRDSSAESRRRAVELAAEAVGSSGMIGGQVADLEAEGTTPEKPGAALESIHRRKTGALLMACMRLGGIYAEAEAATDELLAHIGAGIGLMFQIGDDLLDVESTSEILGKTAGKDERAEKLTYPRVFGLDESRKRLRRIRDETLERVSSLPGRRAVLESFIEYLATRDR